MSATGSPSTLEQNKRLVLRWFEEVWRQGRRETIQELYGAECVLHDGAKAHAGRDEFMRFYDALRAQFSEFSFKPILLLAEGDLACVHWSIGCLHTPSGTPVNLTGISVVRVRNGQFVEAWQNWDEAGLAAQVPS